MGFLFITGAGWALLIPKENCPGEIAGQIVTWLADMPKIGESKWVVKGCDPQDIPEDDRTIDISRYTTGNYETGMACLPLCTTTDALIQYGADDRAAAFPLDAFAVVQAGANLGFLDTEAGIACWKDEDTHGLFWLCDNAGNVPQDVLDAVKHFTPQKH